MIFGIIAGFTGHWWGRGWIWTSLVLLVAIGVAMALLGSNIFGAARKAVEKTIPSGLPNYEKGKSQPEVEHQQPTQNNDSEPESDEQIGPILEKSNPLLLAIIGFGGITIIAFLMVFKPF